MTISYKPKIEGDAVIRVDKPSKLTPPLDSNKVYLIDGVIDLTGTDISLEVPEEGLSLAGYNFNVSKLICSDDDYSLITSPVSGSGDVIIQDLGFSITGTSSKVFDITDSDGTHAIEITGANFLNCTSLGSLTDYRQVLETGTGRIGGTPELELIGAMNGYRIDTSIAFAMSNLSALFKAGTGLTFAGRFITDVNCSLPAIGAIADFSPANFSNDESMIVQGAYIARQGVINSEDTGIFPNIDETSVKSNWKSNTGIPNTKKYIKATSTAETVTTIPLINTYYPIQGTVTVDVDTHFQMSANGEFELLTGTSDYFVTGDLSIAGTGNDVVDIRVTKSTDGGLTYPIEVNHIRRVVNNLSGPRNVAFFPINFITNLSKGDRLRIEVENTTAARDITMEVDSYFIISEA